MTQEKRDQKPVKENFCATCAAVPALAAAVAGVGAAESGGNKTLQYTLIGVVILAALIALYFLLGKSKGKKTRKRSRR